MVAVTGEKIWLDGRFVDWSEARVHVLTHTLHYGLGVFEGIRCYRTTDERSAVFRLSEHIRRLYDSARINLIDLPLPQGELEEVCLETLRRNGLAEGYLRPIAFIGDGEMGLNPGGNPVRVAVAAWAWGKYLGDEGMERGIRAKVSTYSRHHVNSKMTKGKTCGDYVNSILAKREALLDGYDEAIMLDTAGAGLRGVRVRTSSWCSDGVLVTTRYAGDSVLSGITRETVMPGRARQGHPRRGACRSPATSSTSPTSSFSQAPPRRSRPIREVDRRPIGAGARRGPVTKNAADRLLRRRRRPRPRNTSAGSGIV